MKLEGEAWFALERPEPGIPAKESCIQCVECAAVSQTGREEPSNNLS